MFQVFDAMGFQGKPKLSLHPLGLYSGVCTPANRDVPDESYCRALATGAAASGNLLCLDVEHWPVDQRLVGRYCQADQIDKSLSKLAQVCDWIHDETPQVRLGYYSLIPNRDYWSPVQYIEAKLHKGESWWDANYPAFKVNYQQWTAANDRVIEKLGTHVDVAFPSLYTFYDNIEEWEYYAQANIAEARKAHKAVYPFLWMQFHTSTALSGQQISAEFWTRQLALVKKFADGVVIWGGYGQKWDETAGWWTATKQFLEANK